MRPLDIDESFVAQPRSGIVPVAVGDELVLLDGWDVATCLSAAGTAIWSGLDGETSLGELVSDLATATSADERVVAQELVRFVRDLGRQGLLEGVAEPLEDPNIHLEVVPPHAPGDAVADLELPDLAGTRRHIVDLIGSGTALLVNWNPHCGYCARIAQELAGLERGLAAGGCKLVLVATGGAEANRSAATAADLEATVLLLQPDEDMFRSAGTPSAYHLNSERRIIASPAYGADQVLALARKLAGVDDSGRSGDQAEQVSYLLERDGVCGPTLEAGAVPVWSGTRVYRIGDHHVGIRHNSPEAAAALDRMLLHRRVDDPRAGHSFSIALDLDSNVGGRHGGRGFNLLMQPGQPVLRSRDPARVLQALLYRLTDGIAGFDPACGRLQVDAIAVLHEGGAALLPWGLHGFAPRLQPLLAREGIAMADVRRPEVDPMTAELVIPEPTINHDATVLDTLTHPTSSGAERPRVRPGRYPLTAWCAIHPGRIGATRLTPAEAAAATLSTVLHTEDARERVRQLGRLFNRVAGVSIWYDFEPQMVSAVVDALDIDSA